MPIVEGEKNSTAQTAETKVAVGFSGCRQNLWSPCSALHSSYFEKQCYSTLPNNVGEHIHPIYGKRRDGFTNVRA